MERRKFTVFGILSILVIISITSVKTSNQKKDEQKIRKTLSWFPTEKGGDGFLEANGKTGLSGDLVFDDQPNKTQQQLWYHVYRQVPGTPNKYTQHLVYVRYDHMIS